MRFVALKETALHEKRVALTPDITNKLVALGAEVTIESDAGKEAGFLNAAFEAAGAVIEKNRKKILQQADCLLCVQLPADLQELSELSEQAHVIGLLKPIKDHPAFSLFSSKKLKTFSMELMPRITRAQSMDVLSSQSNLSGYKAVIEAANHFGRVFPLMMTAAGTVPAARVLILGAGVAGLQAIATARRLGAIVSAYDVRATAKEQVESLGATFVSVDYNESGDGAGGYAKEMSDGYKIAQEEALTKALATQDIVITTAQIPGKTAPILIQESMLKLMKPGAVIVDLAAETGGNCAVTELGKTITKHGVKILGPANMPSQVPFDASQLYARNIFNFLKSLFKDDTKTFDIDWTDDCVKAIAISHDGAVIHPNYL